MGPLTSSFILNKYFALGKKGFPCINPMMVDLHFLLGYIIIYSHNRWSPWGFCLAVTNCETHLLEVILRHSRCIILNRYELFKPIAPAVSATDIFHNRQQWARRPIGFSCWVNEPLTRPGAHSPKCSDHHRGHQSLVFLPPDRASIRDCHIAAVPKQQHIQP